MCGKGAETPLLQIGFVAPRPHNAVSHDRRGLMLGPTVQIRLFSRLVEMIWVDEKEGPLQCRLRDTRIRDVASPQHKGVVVSSHCIAGAY